ncbi:MAG: ATP-binding protein [Pseudomonadales bacterium]
MDAEQARVIAESATETKSQFLANMSHEIRTPMNAIVGYTNLALETTLTSEQQNYLQTIRNSSNHLLWIVNDILDLSRVESGKLELQKSVFYLRDLLKDLSNLFSLAAKEKGLELRFPNRYENSDQRYIGDSVRIEQVLINLFGNALKFTRNGKVEVVLEVLNLNNGAVSLNFTVIDTGIGIENSQLENIFESFTQGSSTFTEDGTGLGLSISRKLVEMMDGHIHATSKLHEGSQFHFSVVVEQMDMSSQVDDREEVRRHVPTDFSGKQILLVEDNLISQELAREILKKAGYGVTVVDNGEQALQVLAREQFFVVLMDIRMPVLDGMQTIKMMRASNALQHTTVVALSAGVLETEVKAAITAGFDHYMSKPVDFPELLNLLEQIGATEEAGSDLIAEPSVQGVDFQQALRNHGDDAALLNRLTGTFIEIYQHSDGELTEMLASDEFENAERLVHNIAGVAGSFGANNLMVAAREIEHSLQSGSLALDLQVSMFKQELGIFVNAIERLHQEQVA